LETGGREKFSKNLAIPLDKTPIFWYTINSPKKLEGEVENRKLLDMP